MTTNTPIESPVTAARVGSSPLLGRRLFWLGMNAAQYLLAYAWLFESREWAGNVLKFWIAWMAFASLLCFTKSMQESCRKKGRSVPAWMSQGVDVVLALVLASQGHFIMAGVLVFAVIAESAAFDLPNQ